MKIIQDVIHSPEPYSGTVSKLRNMYLSSTQNTDAVSSINFLNPGVNCLLLYYLDQSISMLFQLLGRYDDSNDVNDVNTSNEKNITV